MDSDVEVEGDQDNSYKDLLASVQEDFGPPIDTKLADVLERIWGKAKLGDSQKEELKNMLIPENCPSMKTPLLNPEIYNKVNDSATSRDKITRDIKGKLQDVSPLLYKSLRLNNTMFTEIQRNKKVKFANL